MLIDEFLTLRDLYIIGRYPTLNKQQQRAVLHTNGPLLIIAGAGSGKTTVLVNRIANMIEFGSAYGSDVIEHEVTENDIKHLRDAVYQKSILDNETYNKLAVGKVRPENILAITFTNKAAGELKERIAKKLDGVEGGELVYAATFHSMCAKMLREFSYYVGYNEKFAIYDANDQKALIKKIYKDNGINEKDRPTKEVLNAISRCKDKMLSVDDVKNHKGWEMLVDGMALQEFSDIYEQYQDALKRANAMDFDDLIYYMAYILGKYPAVRDMCNERFKYIMVDEYQDTSVAQFHLVKYLTPSTNNVAVVGDDDQSIYSFRGATVENILKFDNVFKGAEVIKLEENYRSTKTILEAANSVIKNNEYRKDKTLYTNNKGGEKIVCRQYNTGDGEAADIVSTIQRAVRNGTAKYKDFAILYRINSISYGFENRFITEKIPYKIVGGLKFFERKEVKDVLSYLSIVDNPNDDIRLRRIINVPARKIGQKLVDKISELAKQNNCSMMDIIKSAEKYDCISKANLKALKDFMNMYDEVNEYLETGTLSEFVEELVDVTGYREYARRQDEKEDSDMEGNISQMINSVMEYEKKQGKDATLAGYLELVSLMTSADENTESDDFVTLMTMHASKGLEFKNVFIVALENNIFPGEKIEDYSIELEEERRLMYVGITRAQERLYLSSSASRYQFGHIAYGHPSIFLKEIPKELLTRYGTL